MLRYLKITVDNIIKLVGFNRDLQILDLKTQELDDSITEKLFASLTQG
jgi:hypothetical protein